MSTFDNASVAQLLLATLAAAPGLGQLYESEPGCWLLECPSGSGLWLEWVAESSLLAGSTPLGQPDPRHEAASLNLALACNLHWHGRQSLRIARDGMDGDLLLLNQFDLARHSPETLAAELLQFEAVRALCTPSLQARHPDREPPSASVLLEHRT